MPIRFVNCLRGRIAVGVCLLALPLAATSQNLGAWRERTPMPTARVWPTAIPFGGEVYVINGLSGWIGAHWIDAVEAWDPSTGQWRPRKNSPSKSEQYVPALDSGSLVLLAGKGLPTAYRFSPQQNAWLPQPGMILPWAADQNTGAVEVAGRLFALKAAWSEGGWQSSFAEYDHSAAKWLPRRSPDFSAPGPQMVVAQGRIYLLGGGERCDVVEAYDPAQDAWTRKSPLLTGRVEVRGAALNGRIYAAGGHQVGTGVTMNSAEEYDPARDSWRSLPPLPEPRWGVGIAAIHGHLYIFGGSSDAVGATPASNKVWEYVPRVR